MKLTLIVVKHQTEITVPALTFWQISVETPDRSWQESFGSEHEMDLFVKGVKAGAAVAANCFDIEVQPLDASRPAEKKADDGQD